jgi:hypothetical protein
VPIRRISKHLKEQNWFAIWLDLIIVFLAVFIGLQADNWNEERLAKLNAKIYYARLIDDLRAEEVTRLSRITYYEQTLAHGNAALQSLNQSERVLGEKFLVGCTDSESASELLPGIAKFERNSTRTDALPSKHQTLHASFCSKFRA